MFGPILVSVALAAGASSPVVIVNDQATIRVNVADYDLSNAGEERRLRRKIAWAAGKVCDAAIPGALQLELFACAKDSIAAAHQQLNYALAQHRTGARLVTVVAVVPATLPR